MLRKIALLTCLVTTAAGAAPANLSPMGRKMTPERRLEVNVNNWVLAKPNGKPITVLDLSKRMEVVFRREYPQLVDVPEARYQFFKSGWKLVLDEMINTDLILADAEEKGLKVTDGEIRQRIEEMFGPNTVANIDEMGLTFDEAWEMVRSEIIVSRMSGYMVTLRAFTQVGPQDVCRAYQQLTEAEAGKDEWHYQVLSIRHTSEQKAEEAAKIAKNILDSAEFIDLEAVKDRLEQLRRDEIIDSRTAIRVSEVEKRTVGSLAESHKETICSLNPGQVSEPVGQLSRVDKCMAYRIFHLVDYKEQAPPAFFDVEATIHNRLVQLAMSEEQKAYVNKLRRHFGIDENYISEMIPEGFEPFTLG